MQPSGAYNAERSSALSGVPRSTIRHWSREDVLVPSVSAARAKLWSYDSRRRVMPGAVGKLRFALDHNFPANVVATFGTLMPRLELVPIRDIDTRFAELDDWELFVALHRHAER